MSAVQRKGGVPVIETGCDLSLSANRVNVDDVSVAAGDALSDES